MTSSIQQLERVARERNWHLLLAKSPSHGSQSLLSHAKAVSGIAGSFAQLMNISKKQEELLRIAGFLHDMGKEKDTFQRALKKGESTTHIPTKEEIEEFFEDDPALTTRLFFLIMSTHLGTGETIAALKAISEVVDRGEASSLIRLGDILKLSDAIASSTSPEAAYQATQRDDLRPFIKQNELTFVYYSLYRIRGVLTYILHKGIQNAYRSTDYTPIAFYANGALFARNSTDTEDSPIKKIIDNVRSFLTDTLLEDSFLESSTAMQINFGMIANESIVSLESSPRLVEYATKRTSGLPGKSDDQKRAILLRFISTTQNAIRARLSGLDIEEDALNTSLKKLSILERERMGVDFGEIGLPQSYAFWNDIQKSISKKLLELKIAPRELNTLPIEESLHYIGDAYFTLVKNMTSLFEHERFDSLRKMDVESYLTPLFQDVSHPFISEVISKRSKAVQEIASSYLITYSNAKRNCMGKSEGEIRCPICSSAIEGTPAKKAGVGSGTKKFMNLGEGTKRLDNINVCPLCLLEGILRGQIGYGYVLMPQIAFSIDESQALLDISKYLSKLDRVPYKSVGLVLDGTLSDATIEVQEKLDTLCTSEREPFKISKNIIGNYVLMTTYPDTSGASDSDSMTLILFQAIVLHYLIGTRVKILTGLEMIDHDERTGAVIFPTTSTLLNALGLRTGSIEFDELESISKRLAASIRAKLIADLSDRNGILQAMTTHPGQLAQRIVLKRDFPRLKASELDVLTTLLKGGFEMSNLSNNIAEILDKYYRPETYGTSMHSILGPMNALYTEFRKATSLDEESIAAIGGKVHRQLQQLNKGDYLETEAAGRILEVCQQLASNLKEIGPRDRKKMLDDLRYAVYLRRLISINEKIDAKKGGKTK